MVSTPQTLVKECIFPVIRVAHSSVHGHTIGYFPHFQESDTHFLVHRGERWHQGEPLTHRFVELSLTLTGSEAASTTPDRFYCPKMPAVSAKRGGRERERETKDSPVLEGIPDWFLHWLLQVSQSSIAEELDAQAHRGHYEV